MKTWLAMVSLGLLCLATATPARGVGGPWAALGPGLDVAVFDSASLAAVTQGDLTVLRIDPVRWDLRFLTTGGDAAREPRTPKQWCEDFGLVAAINGGMYQTDYQTHVGFCQVSGLVINGLENSYESALALDPVDPEDPPFRIFDLDETDLKVVAARYRTVVQNLRLIKRSRENRWQPTGNRWSECALGQDATGRALLIQCTSPLTMHEFNRIILALPLDLVTAQHLEGSSPARLWIQHSSLLDSKKKQGPDGQTLPFVIGVRARADTLNGSGSPSR